MAKTGLYRVVRRVYHSHQIGARGVTLYHERERWRIQYVYTNGTTELIGKRYMTREDAQAEADRLNADIQARAAQ